MCRNAVGDGLVLEILLHFSSSIHSMLDWSLTMNWKCKPFFLLTCHSWRFVPTRPVWNDTITKLNRSLSKDMKFCYHSTFDPNENSWCLDFKAENKQQAFLARNCLCATLNSRRQIIIKNFMAWNQDPVITQGSNDIKMKALSIYKWQRTRI